MKRMKCCYPDREIKIGGVLVLFAALAVDPVWAAGENVHLYGALVAESCVIPPGEEDIALNFGSVLANDLYANNRTVGQTFSIHLTECDVSISKSVNMTFMGIENAALPGLLAIDSASQASGIAIGLESGQGKPVQINKASDNYLLQDGSNQIELRAYVRGEPDAIKNKSIKRGPFNAVATFMLAYE